MAPARENVETLRLDEVDGHGKDPGSKENRKYCHLFGIFLYEVVESNTICWYLADETCPHGTRIKLRGERAVYPKPKHGDIVRIHRLVFDRYDPGRTGVCTTPNNVVVWTSFLYEPTRITTAQNPTITEEDDNRRRCLETYYCSTLTRISEIPKPDKVQDRHSLKNRFFDVAGCVIGKHIDMYGHCILKIFDGTNELRIRVFRKERDTDCVDHYETANQLKDGDLILVCAVKLDIRHADILQVNLSANLAQGKLIRIIERTSILGVLLENLIKPPMSSPMELSSPESQTTNPSQESIAAPAPPPPPPPPPAPVPPPVAPRRSPRLNQNQIQNQNQNQSQSQSQSQPESQPFDGEATTNSPNGVLNSTRNSHVSSSQLLRDRQFDSQSQPSLSAEPQSQSPQQAAVQPVVLPKYTRISDIDVRSIYTFVDVAGQVRGKPQEVDKQYCNWYFQVYDGTKPKYRNYHNETLPVKQVEPNCITILVYAKKEPFDTDRHIETVKKLEPGDLVHIKNLKVSKKDGNFKFELSANLIHGKGIYPIDKCSDFGRKLFDDIIDATNSTRSSDGVQDAEYTSTSELVEEVIDESAQVPVEPKPETK